MGSRQFLTPDAAAGPTLYRRFCVPGDWAYFLTGALSELTHQYSWEEFGAMTPEEMAQAFAEIVNGCGEDDGLDMIGTYVSYATEDPPFGVLPCDGSTYNRVDYPVLYDRIRNDLRIDADTFEVPDLRGRTLIGSGEGAGLTDRARGAILGEETHVLTTGEMPAHTHTEEGVGAAASTVLGELPGIGVAGEVQATGSTGGGGAHNNMQPSYAEPIGIVALYMVGAEIVGESMPARIGTFFHYLTADPPEGSLACDGSTHDKADYPTLAALLHANVTQDADTFTLPDLRGRTLIGSGQGSGLTNRAIGATVGAETHLLTLGETPSHTHNAIGGNNTATGNNFGGSTLTAITRVTAAAGGGGAHNNMQPSAAWPVAVWYE